MARTTPTAAAGIPAAFAANGSMVKMMLKATKLEKIRARRLAGA
jgi:hypothetical protein